MRDRVQVRTLLCHRDVQMYLSNAYTFVSCCVDPIDLVVHDDGSLTPQDCAALESTHPGIRVIRRRDVEPIMAERLVGHLHAFAFRRESPFGLKLLDVVLAEGGDCYYVDGDIRFLRRFRGLFTRATLKDRSVFLRDTVWDAYSLRPWHLVGRRGTAVVQGINAGLTLVDRSVFDLDFVDWFLAQRKWRVFPNWVEQTCWAALACRSNGYAIDPEQLVNLYPGASIGSRTIGIHLLSSYRNRFRPWQSREPDTTASPTDIHLQSLKPLGPIGLGLNQLKRKFRNEVDRRRSGASSFDVSAR